MHGYEHNDFHNFPGLSFTISAVLTSKCAIHTETYNYNNYRESFIIILQANSLLNDSKTL